MRTLLIVISSLFLSAFLHAEEIENDIIGHLAIYPSYEINPVLSFALVVPPNLSGEPKDSFTMSLNSGNSFNPNIKAQKFGSDCSFSYDVDTMADRLDLRATKRINKNFEAEVSVGAYSPNGKSQLHPLGFFASDEFIEDFHTYALNREDPFGRKEIGYDRSVVSIQDCDGNRLDLKRGDIYLLPLRIGGTYYKDLMSNSRNRTSFNVGTHVAIPLSRASRSVSGAINVNLINTLRINDKWDWTAAIGNTFARQDLITVNPERAVIMENGWYNDTYLSSGFTYTKSNGVKFRMGASLHHKTRFLKAEAYDYTGVDQHGRRALNNPNDNVEVFFSRESKKWVVQLGFREDMRLFSRAFEKRDDNNGGSNSEDVGVNFNVTRRFGKR